MLILAVLAVLAAAAPAPASAARCHRFGADFAPSTGNPQTLRVRFSVWRFGTNRPVYLHYVGPNGHLKRTARLGTAHGVCAFMRTGYRRLFPFTAAPGTWRLLFTTHRGYRARPAPPYVRLAVSVLRR
jgi:hypothetical protein